MMKPILVTGHTGFIGRHLTAELLRKGYPVVGLSKSKALPNQKGLTQFNIDLLNKDQIDNFFGKYQFDSMIHLAWYIGPKCHVSNVNIDWMISSLYILKKFTETGGKYFQGNGTISEYDFSYGYLTEEVTPLNNGSLHGDCKAGFYKVASNYCKTNGVLFKWARCFNLYGPYERSTRLMPSVINSCLKNESVKVSECKKYQDYLYVKDVAKALLKIKESEVEGAINICSSRPVYLREIVEKISELTNFNGMIEWGAIPSSFDDPVVIGNNSKLISLGWNEETSLEQGLVETINWWRTQHV